MRHSDPVSRSKRTAWPFASCTDSSRTLRAKSMRAYRPGDHTGICSRSVSPNDPLTSIWISYRWPRVSGIAIAYTIWRRGPDARSPAGAGCAVAHPRASPASAMAAACFQIDRATQLGIVTSMGDRVHRDRAARPLAFLEQIGARLQPRASRIGHRELRPLIDVRAAVPPVFGDRVVREVVARTLALVHQTRFGHLDRPLQRAQTRLLGRHAGAHLLHHEERTGNLDVRFATSRAARGADIVVAILSRTDNRAGAHAPRNLVRQSARRRHTADVARRRHGVHVDRAVRERDLHIVVVIEPGIVGIVVRLPFEPHLAALVGEQILLLEAHLERE